MIKIILTYTFLSSFLLGWGKTGHRIVGEIAEKYLTKNGIEFRRGNAGGGNQLRQPYLKKYVKVKNLNSFKNVDRVHFFGYYIGNYPNLTKKKVLRIVKILNSFAFN